MAINVSARGGKTPSLLSTVAKHDSVGPHVGRKDTHKRHYDIGTFASTLLWIKHIGKGLSGEENNIAGKSKETMAFDCVLY